VATLKKVAAILGVPIGYFFGEEKVEPEVMRTARFLSDLDADEVSQVYTYAQFVKSRRCGERP